MSFSFIMSELLQGLATTAELFAITLVFSLPLGLLISFGTNSKIKPIKYILKGFVWIIRSTPLMLQVLLISLIGPNGFGVFNKDIAAFFGVSISTLMFIFVSIAFVINYSCYFSEIFRGAISSIPNGQREAGQVLGLRKSQIFNKIVLFQLFKKVLAPMSNEIITLVKDTSIAYVLGVADIFTKTKELVNTYSILSPFIYAAIFYLVFNGLLTLLFGYMEKRLSFYKE